MYKYYTWYHGLIGFETKVQHERQELHTNKNFEKFEKYEKYENFVKIRQHCPNVIKLYYTIGVWNTILFIIFNFYAAMLLKTPVEIQLMNDSKSQYFPAKRRSKLIFWMKNKLIKLGKKIDEWATPSRRVNKNKLKRMQAIAKKNSQNLNFNPKRGISLIAASTLLAMSTNQVKATQSVAYFDTDSKPIGIDNRCTACISHDINDFVGKLHDSDRTIKGFGGIKHRSNIMVGTMKWKWCDDQGQVHRHLIPKSYYVPDGRVRLLSPQHWAKSQKGPLKISTGEFTNGQNCVLQWGKGGEYKLTVPLSRDTNVATFSLAPGYKNFEAYCQEAAIITSEEDRHPTTLTAISDDEEEEQPAKAAANVQMPQNEAWTPSNTPATCDFDLNGPPLDPSSQANSETGTMSENAREMLKLHYKMGHIPFAKMKIMAEQGTIPKAFAKCETPLCSTCIYAKQARRPWRNKPPKSRQQVTTNLQPGDVVSVDQMVSPTAGFIAQMTGILTTKRYKYATVYVDQASRLGYTFIQKTATAEETIKGKIAFELYSLSQGVKVKAYHADNGIFRANAWVNHCNQSNQTITYAAVNAHHQNGIAERRIRELQNMTRTMLIHAAKRWPSCITANLWPYALRQATEILNSSPSMQDAKRRSPSEIFSKTRAMLNTKHFQTFGCPAYVLDNNLQHSSPFHKWKQRSKVGIYLGLSPTHGRNVALVLNRTTGLVSPQFHVKFDSSFHSVEQDTYQSQWQNKAGFIKQEPVPKPKKKKPSTTQRGNKRQLESPSTAQEPEIPLHERPIQGSEGDTTRTSEGVSEVEKDHQNEEEISTELQPKPVSRLSVKSRKRLKTSETGRQTRNSLKSLAGSTGKATPVGLGNNSNANQVHQPHLIEAMTLEISRNTKHDVEGELLCLEAMHPEHKEQHLDMENDRDPLYAFKATSDPDTMYMHQAMREPDWKEFQGAMEKEVTDQMENGNFSIVEKSSVPKGKIILPAVWQMKRKRDIKTRQVKKYKARLNLDGSRQQKGIHYDQTYAPVTSWKFIRLLLIMIVKNGWHSRQIDYVLAFPQAPVEREIYMKIPKGFEIETGSKDQKEHVLKVHKNVYGQCQASRVWYQYLKTKLVKELNFKQSKVDECIFYRGKTIYMLYTDDSILAGPSQKEIDEIIKDLKKAKLNVTDEGDIQDFLGVNIDKQKDGTIHLTQPHLVDQILKDLNMIQDNVKCKDVPAMSSKLLKRDEDGEEFDQSFHYRSIIGKLHYLEKGTRSDIAYITHQCARFAENPKESHAKAIRWLARYLKGTRDKGLIIKPKRDKGLEVYVDADFSGNWDPKAPEMDRDTARSRHGYIVMYQGCPIIWKSQMQTEICMSSTESEYVGLSYALREVIPIIELMKEMKRRKYNIATAIPKVHCKVFEDNSGALEMAKTHKYRPRTKHLNVKYHHFRDYVSRGEISIHKIDTTDQLADYLTKPVTKEILDHLRPQVMGW